MARVADDDADKTPAVSIALALPLALAPKPPLALAPLPASRFDGVPPAPAPARPLMGGTAARTFVC